MSSRPERLKRSRRGCVNSGLPIKAGARPPPKEAMLRILLDHPCRARADEVGATLREGLDETFPPLRLDLSPRLLRLPFLRRQRNLSLRPPVARCTRPGRLRDCESRRKWRLPPSRRRLCLISVLFRCMQFLCKICSCRKNMARAAGKPNQAAQVCVYPYQCIKETLSHQDNTSNFVVAAFSPSLTPPEPCAHALTTDPLKQSWKGTRMR